MDDFRFYQSVGQLDNVSAELVEHAKKATQDAYAPYSRFRVGAALLLDDGTIVTGTNQENAAFPSGMCAERTALFAAGTQHPGKKILKLVVVALPVDATDLVPATCCGGCRQVMVEYETRQGRNYEVTMMGNDGQWIVSRSASALLPFSFVLKN